ncbi:MAG: OmpH family outer membrane protein [Tatlockia sp.]|jgi:outer membrane protein
MKKITGLILLNLIFALFSPTVLAAELKIGVVNVTDLFNKSTYVQKANKELQANVKKMESQLQEDKNNLQTLVNNYEKADPGDKKSLAKQITSAQTELASKTQQYQQKIQEEQNTGMQKFTKLVQDAVQKIAQQKQLNSVLNSNAVLYTDNSWIDITNDVAASLQQ